MRPMKPDFSNAATSARTRGPWGAEFLLPAGAGVLNDPRQPLFPAIATGTPRGEMLSPAAMSSGPVAALLRGILAILRRCWKACRNEYILNCNIRSLEQLDDRSLRDIGIWHRAEIPHLVRYGRRRQ